MGITSKEYIEMAGQEHVKAAFNLGMIMDGVEYGLAA